MRVLSNMDRESLLRSSVNDVGYVNAFICYIHYVCCKLDLYCIVFIVTYNSLESGFIHLLLCTFYMLLLFDLHKDETGLNN